MSKFATSPPARNLDLSPVLDDACDTTTRDAMLDTMPDDAMLDTMLDDTMPDTARDAMLDDTMPDTAREAMLDTALPDDARDAILPDDVMLDTVRDTPFPDVPLGVFLDAHIARVTANARDASETTDTIEIEPAFAPVRSSSPRYELPDIPEGYVMAGEMVEDFLACKDAYDAEKLLLKWKEKFREARMKNDPKFATSPIFVTDKDYEFSVDPEIISLVESDPFHSYESETDIAHLAKLSEIANLFTNEEKIHHHYILKLFPFSLKDDVKAWFTSLAPGCVRSPQEVVYYFCEKHFPVHKKQAALQEIYNFAQLQGESLPQAWGRLIQLQNALPDHPLKKNEILDILYNGLTDASRDHLDSCAGCVFRERTVEQAETLLNNLLINDNAWTILEPPPKPTPKKRGILFFSPEDMQEAKKSMQEKDIRSEDVKNLPPIEEIHGLNNPIHVVELNSPRRFDESDIPVDKPASLCFDEFDNFVAKQQSFNDYVSRHLEQSTRMLSHLSACVDRNVNALKLLSKHASMITTQVEQVLKAQNDLLNELNDNSVRVITRGGKMAQEPLYPEGHPKRIDQDSRGINADTPSHPKEKKKDDRDLHASSPNTITPEEPNDISASDAETQSGDEHEPGDNIDNDVHNNAQPSNDEDVEIEPTVNPDNPQPKRYDKNDFTTRKHGKEREPWVQRPMPFPPKPSKKKDDEDFERFIEMIRPVFLQMRLTDMLKMSPYAKYMKDIMTNKRKIPDLEISTMLANYTFKGGTPKKLGDPGVPTIPCSIKGNYIRTALCDLGAGVIVMLLYLYRRLELDKLTPTEISLQMADKSAAFPIGICEDVPVVVANTTILTDFVILDIPEDDAMSIILGRPFLNTAGAVIDCNKGNVTFHVNGNEHTMHFPKK
ncbi:hypothetical protein ZWY2020_025637 [Hordeum vulgare]|nr:hypothetical protein ZWY2020_025637 [Hordeum vulgare]